MVPRGEKHPLWASFGGMVTTSSQRGREVGGGARSAKGDRSCGGQRRSTFVPSDQPSGGRSRRVRRNSSGPSPWGKRSDASKRSCNPMRCEPDSTWSLARDAAVTPRMKEVTPEPESKTIALPASRQREGQLSIGSTSCISGEGVSEHPRGTGRPAVSKAQDANDSCRKDHAASDAPGGLERPSEAEGTPRKERRKRDRHIIFSELDGECREFEAESEELGLEPCSGVMQASKRYSGGLLRSFLRTIGGQVVTTGDTQGALGEARLKHNSTGALYSTYTP